MTKTLIATGIFMWDSSERRSDRYGRFYCGSETYSAKDKVLPTFESEAAKALMGKRVRITVEVVAARESGHIGDIFHGISPMKPEKGDIIDLGVGTFDVGRNYNDDPDIGLCPNDGRGNWWINPHQLFKLHDQTVKVFVEETQDEFRGDTGRVSWRHRTSSSPRHFRGRYPPMRPSVMVMALSRSTITIPGRDTPKGEIFRMRKTNKI